MKIEIDKNACIGCGMCVSLCDECFKLNEEGKAEVVKDDCENCDVEEVVKNCPVNAITIKK